MRARGSGDRECLTQDLSSLVGVVGLLEALNQELGSIAEYTLGVLLHEPSDRRLGVTPLCDEDFLVHKDVSKLGEYCDPHIVIQ